MDNNLGFNEELMKIFMVEALEQLDRFTQALLVLEKEPQDVDALNELFRIAHSLKGTSGMVGFDDIKESMHAAEDLLDAARSGKVLLNSEDFDLLLTLNDAVTLHLSDSSQPFAKEDWVERLRALLQPQGTTEKMLPAPPLVLSELEKQQISSFQENGKRVYGFEITFEHSAPLRSVTVKVFLKALEEIGEVFKTAPAQEEIFDENFSCFKTVCVCEHELTDEETESITCIKKCNPGVTEVTWREWVYRPSESRKTEHTVNERGEKVVADTIRVDSEKLQVLLNTVGDLLSVKASLEESIHSGNITGSGLNALKLQMYQFNQTLSLLQSEVMQLRMVPIQQLFGRFPRVIRDLAHKSGKDVELICEGEGTEIDKKVMEFLVDPLTHLIRNAIDHGIESPELREAHGKCLEGSLRLKASQEGNNIVIEVSDDGAGIDPEKIRAKAISRGVAQPDKTYTQEEIYEFLFSPGFSTAEKITEISGRGVGLDVVKTNLGLINGSVTVESDPGRGSSFRLVVPLTLAIINAFLVKVHGQVFAIPAHDMMENIAISAKDLHQLEDVRVIRLREEVIPVIDAGEMFYHAPTPVSSKQPVAVVGNRQKKAGLLVEEFLEPREVMIRPVNAALGQIDYTSGVTVLGNGQVALILDVIPMLKAMTKGVG